MKVKRNEVFYILLLIFAYTICGVNLNCNKYIVLSVGKDSANLLAGIRFLLTALIILKMHNLYRTITD